MKTSDPHKKTTWQRTSVQNLLRNRQSGDYYGCFTISGKQKWYALEPDVLSVAKLRLADKAGKIQRLRGTTANVEAGDATMHDLIEVFKTRTQANADIKPGDRDSSSGGYLAAESRSRSQDSRWDTNTTASSVFPIWPPVRIWMSATFPRQIESV